MKAYLYILISVLVFSSCTEGFLEEKPKSFLSPENFYKNSDDLYVGLNAVYRTPQDRYSNLWAAPHWFDWGTDIEEITDKSTWAHHNQIARLNSTFNSSSTIPEDFWRYIFNHVKDVNFLLEATQRIDIPQEEKDLISAQAKAIRAFLYFDAVRVFNGVPIMLETSSDLDFLNSQSRATPEEMYDVIIDDLLFAKNHLPNTWEGSDNLGRITAGAAAAMLAKVYMAMAGYPLNNIEKWSEAKLILDEFIIEKKYGSQYALETNYEDLFNSDVAPGVEGIWTINFTRGTFGQGSDIHTNFAPLELYYAAGIGLTYGGGWSNGIPTERFYNSFDKEKDSRFKHTFWTSTADVGEEYDKLLPKDDQGNVQHIQFYRPHVKKFREPTPNNNSQRTSLDHYIIRYADVLLMYAEVLNELEDPNKYVYINMVRERAGLDNLNLMSKDEFRSHLFLERAWELGFNNERKFDLLRWNVYAERTEEWNPQVKGNIVNGKHEFWPVPQSQIDLNPNLTQNPLW